MKSPNIWMRWFIGIIGVSARYTCCFLNRPETSISPHKEFTINTLISPSMTSLSTSKKKDTALRIWLRHNSTINAKHFSINLTFKAKSQHKNIVITTLSSLLLMNAYSALLMTFLSRCTTGLEYFNGIVPNLWK
jgi:hypothetical protein